MNRLFYPLDLEWIEGLMMQHGTRVMRGESLYLPPSITFITSVYTPLYYYVIGALFSLFGPSYVLARGVSLVAGIGSAVVLFALIQSTLTDSSADQKKQRICIGIVTTILYLSYDFQTEFWFTLVRVDTLMLFFLVASFYKLYTAKNRTDIVISEVLFIFAVLTKQTILIFLLLFVLFAIKEPKYRKILLLLPLLLLGIAIYAWIATDGWFFYYHGTVTLLHKINWNKIKEFGFDGAILFFLLVIFVLFKNFRIRVKRNYLIWSAFCLSLFIGIFGKLNNGGVFNVYQPLIFFMYFVLSLLFIQVGFSKIQKITFVSGVIIQIIYLIFSCSFFTANYTDKILLKETLQKYQGKRVFIPFQSFMSEEYFSQYYFHEQALFDIGSGSSNVSFSIPQEITLAIEEKKFDVIILPASKQFVTGDALITLIESNYCNESLLFSDDNKIFTKSYERIGPYFVYLPKRNIL